MVKLICEACGYSFSPKGDKMPRVCPYCNRGPVVKQKSAQELIDDFSMSSRE